MAKATPRGYIDTRVNKNGEPRFRAKVRVRDKTRPTGYYELNKTWDTLKEAENWLKESFALKDSSFQKLHLRYLWMDFCSIQIFDLDLLWFLLT